VAYAPTQDVHDPVEEDSPLKVTKKPREEHESDTDFQASSDEEDAADGEPPSHEVNPAELQTSTKQKSKDTVETGKPAFILHLSYSPRHPAAGAPPTVPKTAAFASHMRRPAVKSVKVQPSKSAASRKGPKPAGIKPASRKARELPVFKSTFVVPKKTRKLAPASAKAAGEVQTSAPTKNGITTPNASKVEREIIVISPDTLTGASMTDAQPPSPLTL